MCLGLGITGQSKYLRNPCCLDSWIISQLLLCNRQSQNATSSIACSLLWTTESAGKSWCCRCHEYCLPLAAGLVYLGFLGVSPSKEPGPSVLTAIIADVQAKRVDTFGVAEGTGYSCHSSSEILLAQVSCRLKPTWSDAEILWLV